VEPGAHVRALGATSDESYNALLLLWPDAENFPVGGEIDFMEMLDHTRQTTDIFIHYGEDNSQVNGQVEVDATKWHNWAVEWTPEAITAYVDGEEWYRITDTSIFPPGPMHLCVQLDWFPDDAEGAVKESQMHVDWVRYYPLDESAGTESGSRRGTGETGERAGESTDAGADEGTGGAETGTTPRRWAGVTGEGSQNRGQSEETDPFSRIREAIRRLFYWR
jgi:beta-glucanase (GH16 family)